MFPFGFFVVFVVKADDYECTGEMKQTPVARNKTLSFDIREKISYQNLISAIISILGIFASFCFLTIVIFFYSLGR